MKWFLLTAIGLLGSGLALAGDPVTVSASKPPVRPVGYLQAAPTVPAPQPACGDVSGSLAQVLATSLPTTPSVPVPSTCQPCPPGSSREAQCGTPLFPGIGRPSGDRTCLNRFKEWLCFQPGPRVLPILTPTPYHAPIQAYFPCKPGPRPAPCAPACDSSHAKAPLFGFRLVNAGCEGDCPRPLIGSRALFERRPAANSAPASPPMPVATAYSPSAYTSGTCTSCNAGGSFFDRLLAFFVPGQSRCTYARWGRGESCGSDWSLGPNWGAESATPGFAGPMLAGYRFASPAGVPVGVGQPAAMGAYPVTRPSYNP